MEEKTELPKPISNEPKKGFFSFFTKKKTELPKPISNEPKKNPCIVFVFSEKFGNISDPLDSYYQIKDSEKVLYCKVLPNNSSLTVTEAMQFIYKGKEAFFVYQNKFGNYLPVKGWVGSSKLPKYIYSLLNRADDALKEVDNIVKKEEKMTVMKIFVWLIISVVFIIGMQFVSGAVVNYLQNNFVAFSSEKALADALLACGGK